MKKLAHGGYPAAITNKVGQLCLKSWDGHSQGASLADFGLAHWCGFTLSDLQSSARTRVPSTGHSLPLRLLLRCLRLDDLGVTGDGVVGEVDHTALGQFFEHHVLDVDLHGGAAVDLEGDEAFE